MSIPNLTLPYPQQQILIDQSVQLKSNHWYCAEPTNYTSIGVSVVVVEGGGGGRRPLGGEGPGFGCLGGGGGGGGGHEALLSGKWWVWRNTSDYASIHCLCSG